VSGLKDEKLIKKLKHANSILESFEYFCQMSSKSNLIILSCRPTVSNLVHFWDTVYNLVLVIYFLITAIFWWMFGAQVSYVSRWRAGVTSSAHSSGYCSNCSELHDSKTTPVLQTQRRQRTCSYNDVKRMSSLNNMLTGGTSSQQPSVKNELNSSLEVSILYW